MILIDTSNFLLELESARVRITAKHQVAQGLQQDTRQQNKINDKVEHPESGGTSQRESKKNSCAGSI